LEAPGALHYIIVMGIDKTVIFREDRDKIKFLEKMGACGIHCNVSINVPLLPLCEGGRFLFSQETPEARLSRKPSGRA
jgi:hypothetical protein